MSRLQLVCQVCWQPIEFGHLGIDTAAVAAYQAAEAARKARPAGDEPDDALSTTLEPLTWVTHCEGCEDRLPNTCGYCIQVSQLRTYKDLVRWTGHLMGKTWFAATDWNHMLEEVAEGRDRRFREVAR